ncbi:MAG: hypothetical protein HC769_07670 [Cyanobacteria bacterium CRU_2_1]|nr:hypothetical protein [Cyanobacteria bacterium CRU_2_1]
MAMVFQLRQPVGEPIGSEQIRLNYPAPGKAVVTVVIRGLQDDSVNATRTRYEFQPAPSSTDTNRLWQITQVTQQNKCQPGRGPQDWSGELCN